MKLLSLLKSLLVAILFVSACDMFNTPEGSGDNIDDIPQYYEGTWKMKTMNISGSKYLYTTGNNTKTNADMPGLYSIDENGNVSMVFGEFEKTYVDSLGAVVHTENIKLTIVPDMMYNLYDKYIVMQNRQGFLLGGGIFDEDGSTFPCDSFGMCIGEDYMTQISRSYGGYAGELNILVRISDGKMFPAIEVVPFCDVIDDVLYKNAFTYIDTNDDIYFNVLGLGSKRLVDNGDYLSVEDLNPSGILINKPRLLKNGTLFTQYSSNSEDVFAINGHCLIYPNGGLDFIDYDENIALLFDDGEIMALKKEYINDSLKIELYNYNEPSSVGEYSLGEKIAEMECSMSDMNCSHINDLNFRLGGWISNEYEIDLLKAESHYIFGNIIKWDKNSDKLNLIDKETYDIIRQLDLEHILKEKLWSLDFQNNGDVTVTDFNIETLSSTTNIYHVSDMVGPFRLVKSQIDMNSGKTIINGLRLSDGKSIIVTLDFTTGEMTYVENDDASKITNITPLN